jgi:hypothetical protein
MTNQALARLAQGSPPSPGVYRLYCGKRILHVGMAAGGATLRSELLAHARGEYGAATQSADRVDWEVAPDAAFAYRRFLSVFASATYDASGNATSGPHSVSTRHSRHLSESPDEAPVAPAEV